MSLEPVRRRSSSIPLSIVNKKFAVSPYNINGNVFPGKEIRINYLQSKKHQATTATLKLTLPTGDVSPISTGSGLVNTDSWKHSDKEQTTLNKTSHFRAVSGYFGKQTVSECPTEESNTDEKSNERYFSPSSGLQLSNVETSEHRTMTITKQYKDQRDSFSEIKTVSPKYKNETASLKYDRYKIIRSSTSFENQNNAVQENYITQRKRNGREKSHNHMKGTSKFKKRPLQTSETPYFVIAPNPNQHRNKSAGAENTSQVSFSVRHSDQSKSSGKPSPRDTVSQTLTDLPMNISNDLSVYLHEEVRDVETSTKKIHKPAAAAVNLECKLHHNSRKNYEINNSHEMNQNSNDVLKTCKEAIRGESKQDIQGQGIEKGTQRKRNCWYESESEHNLIKTESEILNTEISMPDGPTQSSGKAEEASGGDQKDFILEHDPTIVIPGTSILQRLQTFSSALKLFDSETHTLKEKGTLEKASNDVLDTIAVVCAANIRNCDDFLVKEIDDYEKRCHYLRKKHKLRTLTNYIVSARASKELNDKLFLLRQLFMMLKFNDGSHLVQKRALTEEQEWNSNTKVHGSSTPRSVKHQHTNRTYHRLSNASTETFRSSSSSKMCKTFKYSQVVQESLKAIYGFDLTNLTQKHVPLRRKSKSAMVGSIKNAEINQIENIYTNITCNRRLFRNQAVTNCLPLSTVKDKNFIFKYRPPSYSSVF